MNKLHLRDYLATDNPVVKNLVSRLFGLSYISSKPDLFQQPVFIIACIADEIVGFCSGKVIDDNVGLLDMLVVSPNFQKQGIGTALFKARLDKFMSLNIQGFMLHHWVKKEHNEPVIALKHGFKLKENTPNYWKKESLQLIYHCAECGPPPCSCSCKTYCLTLPS